MMEFENMSSSEQRAFAIMLKCQKEELLGKIRRIDENLKDIATYGIDIDDLPNYNWIRVDPKEK